MNASLQFEEFKSGNEVAFRMLFDQYYKALFLFAKRYLTDENEIEDVLQEIFIMLWEKRDGLKDVQSLKAFLYVSVRNKALNILRHKKQIDKHQNEQLESMEDESFYAQNLIDTETYRLLNEAIDKLPAQTQTVSRLSLNGARNTDIAEQLNITTSTVKYHKQQALKLLKQHLGNNLALIYLIAALFNQHQ